MSESFLVEQFQKGGPMMWPLLLCSVLAITFIVERAWTLWRVSGEERLEEELGGIRRVLSEEGMEAVLEGTVKGKGVLNFVFARLIRRYDALRGEGGPPEEMRSELMREADDAGREYLGRFFPALATLGSLSPLMGLLGTIMGMIKAFGAIASAGAGDPSVVAAGISEALITTAAGLMIAIPTIACHRYLAVRASRILKRIETYTHAFGTSLLEEGNR